MSFSFGGSEVSAGSSSRGVSAGCWGWSDSVLAWGSLVSFSGAEDSLSVVVDFWGSTIVGDISEEATCFLMERILEFW